MGNEMVKGRLGSISRMSPEVWKRCRSQVFDPASREIGGRLAYCRIGTTLFAGDGYPVSELAPVLDVEDMADVYPVIEAAGLPKAAADLVTGFVRGRLMEEERKNAKAAVSKWASCHDYISDFDNLAWDVPTGYLRELMERYGAAAVYMAGFYDGEGTVR
jgi:hypothetical protein